MTHFDLAIIGSGSGNSLPDERFADRKIAILEEGTYGGTCLNVGCIPTKMFVYAAEVARTVTGSAKYGVDAQLEGVRWPDIVKRVFGRIDPISAGGERYRAEDSPNTTLFRGHATFTGPRTLDTGTGEVITADQVVVAAGSRPIIPDVVRESGVPFYTNNDIMRLPELPQRMVIIGAGFIAAEFAHVFSALGTRVSLIARSTRLLRHLDEDVSRRFTDLAEQKWDVHRGHAVTAVRRDGDGVAVELADGTVVSGDVLLVATGRQSNGDAVGPPPVASISTTRDASWSTTSNGPVPKVFTRSATSPRRTSSSTSPTTRPGSFSTICCRTRGRTRRGCAPRTTGSFPPPCSPTRRSRTSG